MYIISANGGAMYLKNERDRGNSSNTECNITCHICSMQTVRLDPAFSRFPTSCTSPTSSQPSMSHNDKCISPHPL